MITSVKLLVDSVSEDDIRVTSFELKFPTSLLAPILMYRQFSRSYAVDTAQDIVHMVLTATEYDNFFSEELDNKNSPLHKLAVDMNAEMGVSFPVLLLPDTWHAPYITSEDVAEIYKNNTRLVTEQANEHGVASLGPDPIPTIIRNKTVSEICLLSARLCDDPSKAYQREEIHPNKDNPSFEAFEHQCTPDSMVSVGEGTVAWNHFRDHGNFVGWRQRRKAIVYESPVGNKGIAIYQAKAKMRSVRTPLEESKRPKKPELFKEACDTVKGYPNLSEPTPDETSPPTATILQFPTKEERDKE